MNQPQVIYNIIDILKHYPWVNSCIIASYSVSDESQVKYSIHIQLAHINESPIRIFSSDSHIRYATDTSLLEYDLKLIELQSLQINVEKMLKESFPIIQEMEKCYKYLKSEHV